MEKERTYSQIAVRADRDAYLAIRKEVYSENSDEDFRKKVTSQIKGALMVRRTIRAELNDRLFKFLRAQGIENPEEEILKNEGFKKRFGKLHSYAFHNCCPSTSNEPLNLADWWLRN